MIGGFWQGDGWMIGEGPDGVIRCGRSLTVRRRYQLDRGQNRGSG